MRFDQIRRRVGAAEIRHARRTAPVGDKHERDAVVAHALLRSEPPLVVDDRAGNRTAAVRAAWRADR